MDDLKQGLEAACELQNWLEDNLPDDIFDMIPVEIWNAITEAVMKARES